MSKILTPESLSVFPRFVALGEALTDLIQTGNGHWVSKTGGATWNVARVVARLGIHSGFAGAISEDIFGNALWAASEDAKLDLRFLQRVNKTPLLAIVYETNPPSYFFIGNDSADLQFDPTVLPHQWQTTVEWAHFGGISLAREPLASKLVNLASELKSLGIRISYDPNYRLIMDESYMPTLQRMTELADVIKISDEDLSGLFKTDDAEAALSQLRSWNPTAAYLHTQGAKGASLYLGKEKWQTHPPLIAVVDSVGAGDASMGGIIYSLMTSPEKDWYHHLKFAVAAGAGACLEAGAVPPDMDTIQRLFI